MQKTLSLGKPRFAILSDVARGPDEHDGLLRAAVVGEDDLHRCAGGHLGFHPGPATVPVTAGESLAGCSTPPEQLAALFDAGRKYRSFKYWDKVRVGSSESHITGQGFNAVKFDPRKPARTVRRNDGNLGMHGAMHWSECRRFSLPEFKRFGSFPDEPVIPVAQDHILNGLVFERP